MGGCCQQQPGSEGGEEQEERPGLLAPGAKGLLDTTLHCEILFSVSMLFILMHGLS